MPLLQWASAVVGKTNASEREQMQSIFDTAFWTLSVNGNLCAETEIPLMVVPSWGSLAFACRRDGRWRVDFK